MATRKQISVKRYAEEHEAGAWLTWPEEPLCVATQGVRYRGASKFGRLRFHLGGKALVNFTTWEGAAADSGFHTVAPGQPCAAVSR